VAIAITLLALALPVPHSTDGTSNTQLLHELGRHWSEYFAFLISFAVIGSHWAAHRAIFRYVIRLDRRVTALNMLWLLMMVLTPFAARLLSGNGGLGIRFTFYAAIQIIASACLALMSQEITRRDLLRPDAPESARRPDHVPSVTIIVTFLVSIPVAFFSPWAFALWAAVPVITRATRRYAGRTRRGRA
jgi:uncharacterized membrane protein